MHRVPPLAAIEAFIAAMKSGSFRAAATTIGISPSAFSRRIATLEGHLGIALFTRSAGRPVPTDAARRFLQDVAPSIDAVQSATRSLRGEKRRPALRALVAPSLAADWLLPRLADGLRRCEIADFSIEVGEPGCALDPSRHDIALLATGNADHGRPWEILAPIEAAVVAAPALVDDTPPPSSAQDLAAFSRLDVVFPDALWLRWSERSGAPMPRDGDTARFASLATMYEAASAGFGLALAVPLVAERRLRDGALKVCFRGLTPLGFDYRIIYRDVRTRRRPEVQSLASWLRQSAESSCAAFRALAA